MNNNFYYSSDSFKERLEYGARYIPYIQLLLGPYLSHISTPEQDIYKAIDLVVPSRTIACRVTKFKPDKVKVYGWCFNFRPKSDGGTDSELDKILRGACDLFFFGRASEFSENGICRWLLIDLKSFRHHCKNDMSFLCPQKVPCFPGSHDGTYFFSFDVRRFPPNPPILAACSEDAYMLLPSIEQTTSLKHCYEKSI